MKTGENMHCNDNIDGGEHGMCSSHAKSEEMLILKARSLKELDKTYKFLECIGDVLKINPHNEQALTEIAIYLKEG